MAAFRRVIGERLRGVVAHYRQSRAVPTETRGLKQATKVPGPISHKSVGQRGPLLSAVSAFALGSTDSNG
jgi:hypothetical protein